MIERKSQRANVNESKLLLEIDVFGRQATDPTAAFLSRLEEKHDVGETEFLVDAGGYLTTLARRKLSGQLNDSKRNHIEKWFQTVSMWIDRFHSSGGAVQPAHAAGSDASDITTTTIGRIKR